jgi:hypothetical protein
MSSAAAGTAKDVTTDDNAATADLATGTAQLPAVCSTTSAEAEQGDGPAAASASASGSADGRTDTMAVTASCSTDFAAAACPIGVVAVGRHAASAAGRHGAVSVSLTSASASGTAANGSKVAIAPDPMGLAAALKDAVEALETVRSDIVRKTEG